MPGWEPSTKRIKEQYDREWCTKAGVSETHTRERCDDQVVCRSIRIRGEWEITGQLAGVDVRASIGCGLLDLAWKLDDRCRRGKSVASLCKCPRRGGQNAWIGQTRKTRRTSCRRVRWRVRRCVQEEAGDSGAGVATWPLMQERKSLAKKRDLQVTLMLVLWDNLRLKDSLCYANLDDRELACVRICQGANFRKRKTRLQTYVAAAQSDPVRVVVMKSFFGRLSRSCANSLIMHSREEVRWFQEDHDISCETQLHELVSLNTVVYLVSAVFILSLSSVCVLFSWQQFNCLYTYTCDRSQSWELTRAPWTAQDKNARRTLCSLYHMSHSRAWNAYTWHVLEDLIFYGQ